MGIDTILKKQETRPKVQLTMQSLSYRGDSAFFAQYLEKTKQHIQAQKAIRNKIQAQIAICSIAHIAEQRNRKRK